MKWYEFGPIAWARDFLNTHPKAEKFLDAIGLPAEAVVKKTLFGCQSCGQCLLHENGMTCPMRCPKNSRNGPCGGVRANGHCEVYPGTLVRVVSRVLSLATNAHVARELAQGYVSRASAG